MKTNAHRLPSEKRKKNFFRVTHTTPRKMSITGGYSVHVIDNRVEEVLAIVYGSTKIIVAKRATKMIAGLLKN